MLKKSTLWAVMAMTLAPYSTADAAELWGNIIASDAWSNPRDSYGVYSFPSAADGFEFTLLKHKTSMNVNGGGTYFDGHHYWVNWESYGMGSWYADDYNDDWRNIDGDNFFDQSLVPWDLTYNPKDGAVYGIFNSGMQISTIDFSTLKTSAVTTIYNFPVVAIASTKEGVVYWIDSSGNVSFWNTQYGFGFAQSVVNTGVRVAEEAQSAAFDDETGLLYWATRSESGETALYCIDVAKKNFEKVTDFPNNEYVVSLRVVNDAAASGAPAKVSDLIADFAPGALSGKVSFTLPLKSIGGDDLDGTLDYTVNINGKAYTTGTGKPGESVSLDMTVAEGSVNLSVIVSNQEGEGQEAKSAFYAGNDTPESPSHVTLAEADGQFTLTWSAPGATGSHGGYVDTESLTYTVVRYPDETTVITGLKETAYSEAVPDAPLTSYYYNVYAEASGKQSLPGRSGSVVAGNALEAPWLETFATRDGFTMFDVIDVAGDWSTWMWMSRGYAQCSNSYYADNDDWLISPPIHLKADRTYVVSFQTSVEEGYMPQALTVLWGSADSDATAYTDEIMPLTELDNEEWTRYEKIIRAPKDGNYKIAFHCTAASGFYSLMLKNIAVEEGALLSAPAAPEEVSATAGALGAMEATVSFTAPSLTLGGDALTAIDRIEVTCGDRHVGTISDATPGKAYTVKDESAAEGVATYSVTAYATGEVKGEPAYATCYVGIDTPSPLSDIQLIDNGDGSATLRWGTASTTGANGGYVNPNDVTYNIYTSANDLVEAGITSLSYDIASVEQTAQPSSLIYRVTANNSKGESAKNRSSVMLLGPAVSLPFAESFAGGTPAQHWFLESPNSLYSFRATTLMSQDGDLGANSWRSGGSGEEAWIASAKISAKGAATPVLTFWYYAYPATPNGLGVYLSCAGKEVKELTTIDYSSLDGSEGWRKAVLPISEASALDYISVRFRGFAGEENATIAIDNILVADMPERDYGVAMTSPMRTRRGIATNIPVTVANNGMASDVPFSLTVNINGSETEKITGTLASGEEHTYNISYTPTLADGNLLSVMATVVSDGDAVADNNSTPVATIEITPADGLAAVSDLAATATGSDVQLTWSAPENVDGGITTDSFEHAEPWATDGIGDWTTIDGDGFKTFGIYDVEWPGKMQPHAFIVFNPTLATGLTGEEEEFLPHSGSQFLACFNADPEEPTNVGDVRNDDWLISPLLSGKPQTISFYAQSLDPYGTPETFELMTSSTGTATTDFTVAAKRTVNRSGWVLYTFDLPEGTQYFAIHVVSVNCYALFVDDITYEGASAKVEGYNVYRDGKLIASTDTPSYADTNANGGDHTYFVGVRYDRGESDPSNEVALSLSGIDSAATDASHHDADIFTLTGIKVGHGHEDLDRLPAGIYIMGGKKIAITR